MSNDKNEEPRLPERRPFTLNIDNTKIFDVFDAYRKVDDLIFKKQVPKKKKRFL